MDWFFSNWIKIAILIFAYLIGSFPVGFLIIKWKRGIDITGVGSGSMGFANTKRVLANSRDPLYHKGDEKWSYLILLLDIAKGFFPVFLARGVLGLDLHLSILIAIYTIFGHCHSIFLGWRGGKGVATFCGTLLFFQPWTALTGFIIYWTVKGVSKKSSLGSFSGLLYVLISNIILYFRQALPREMIGYFLAVVIIILISHWQNIFDLIKKKEKNTS